MRADLCKVYLVRLIGTSENNHVSGFSEFLFSSILGKGRGWEKVTDARPNLTDVTQLPGYFQCYCPSGTFNFLFWGEIKLLW